jgi:NAD(P)-dependent dehydrogenase (short-subunit alcohol dehydrogenase family)
MPSEFKAPSLKPFRHFQCFRKFYYPADSYNKSKLAQVLFTRSLEKLFAEHNLKLQSHSLHPGVVNTELFEHSSTDYVPWVRKLFKVNADSFC